MYSINSEIDLKKIENVLNDALKESTSACMNLLKTTAKDITEEAQSNIKRNSYKTGKLHNSLKYKINSAGDTATIQASANHASYIEDGTRPHIIRPKKASVLAFKGNSGETVFAKQVNHPGTKANPFLEPAFNNNVPKFIKGLEDIADGNY